MKKNLLRGTLLILSIALFSFSSIESKNKIRTSEPRTAPSNETNKVVCNIPMEMPNGTCSKECRKELHFLGFTIWSGDWYTTYNVPCPIN